MRRTILLLALGGAAALAACDQPQSEQIETAPPSVEAPMAPAAEDQAVPASDAEAPTTPATDPSTIPPEQRSSEQTVQPESETLFY